MKKLSNEQLIECIGILEQARETIIEGDEYYLCNAIYMAGGKYKLRTYLMDWVQDMLQTDTKWCVPTYGMWLMMHHPQLVKKDAVDTLLRFAPETQNARAQWAQWMIDELQKERK